VTSFSGSAAQYVHLQDDVPFDSFPIVFSPGHRLVPPFGLPFGPRVVHRLPANGTYQVVQMAPSADVSAEPVEVDSLVDAGRIQVDGPTLTVDSRPDGRWTIASIPEPSQAVYLTVDNITVSGPWLAYAGILPFSCPEFAPLGCGPGNVYVSLTSEHDSLVWPLLVGGHLVVDPGPGGGSLDVGLTTTKPAG
jgi:hypothetical protein